MEENKRPRVNKEKLAEQLTRLADFEVEWILRIVQEEWDRRNFDWVKVEDLNKTSKGVKIFQIEGQRLDPEIEELE